MSKSIVLDTEAVQAILEGRKTRHSMPLKDIYDSALETAGDFHFCNRRKQIFYKDKEALIKSIPYQVGDILWVKETWLKEVDEYFHKAGISRIAEHTRQRCGYKWRSSIHMPKEAARVFLRVKDIRVERLWDIMEDDAKKEGFEGIKCECNSETLGCDYCFDTGWEDPPTFGFAEAWNQKYRKQGYGWSENPYVRVIEFERVNKEGQPWILSAE